MLSPLGVRIKAGVLKFVIALDGTVFGGLMGCLVLGIIGADIAYPGLGSPPTSLFCRGCEKNITLFNFKDVSIFRRY